MMNLGHDGGIKYKSEEEVYEDTVRLMEVWKEKYKQARFANRSYLASIKPEFRSKRICQLIFSDPEMFNLNEEIKNVPIQYMNESFSKRIERKPRLEDDGR